MPGATKPLALTMGEPAGIGAELALAAWRDRTTTAVPVFFIIDDPKRLEQLSMATGMDVPITAIQDPAEVTTAWHRALPVLPQPLPEAVTPGQPATANSAAALTAIERAVQLVQAGKASAVVTNPINKKVLYDAGFSFPGHTEYLAHLANTDQPPVMLLASADLRVVPATIHIPLAAVPERLTIETICHCARTTATALKRDFAVPAPRLAIAGLNPHAGENGALGAEENTIIKPAIAELRSEGLSVSGPWPPDTMFHATARRDYDAAICMYHDQALIPLKTLAFDSGVNVTLGLPFIRTSPDHGTAFDIAGTGTADPGSLVEALRLAHTLATNRAAATA